LPGPRRGIHAPRLNCAPPKRDHRREWSDGDGATPGGSPRHARSLPRRPRFSPSSMTGRLNKDLARATRPSTQASTAAAWHGFRANDEVGPNRLLHLRLTIDECW